MNIAFAVKGVQWIRSISVLNSESGICLIASCGGWLSCMVLFRLVRFFFWFVVRFFEKFSRGIKISAVGKVLLAMSVSLSSHAFHQDEDHLYR